MQRRGQNEPTVQGKLYKLTKGFRGRTWSKRFFIISGPQLAYYASESTLDKGPHRVINLTGLVVVDKGRTVSGGKVRSCVVWRGRVACARTRRLGAPAWRCSCQQ
jgi:hypothetical protein